MISNVYRHTSGTVFACQSRSYARNHKLPASVNYSCSRAFRNGGGGKGIDGKKGTGGGDDDDDRKRKHSEPHWIYTSVAVHALLLSSRSALAASDSAGSKTKDGACNWRRPVLLLFGSSGAFGLCSAIAFRFFGSTPAAGCLVLDAVYQVLVLFNVIKIDWNVVERELNLIKDGRITIEDLKALDWNIVKRKLDVTGDDRFNVADVIRIYNTLLPFLAKLAPAIGGFGVGFIVGLIFL